MNLVLAGLSDRDQHAFGLFLKRFMPTWKWRAALVVKGELLPVADVLIVDLAASGWAQRTDRNLAELAQAVGKAVAVLLVSAHDTTWSEGEATDAQAHWVWLGKPYNAESMRRALTQAEKLAKARVVVPAPKVKAIAKPANGHTVSPSDTWQGGGLVGLSPNELRERLSYLQDHQHVLLRKLDAALRLQQPFEVRFTIQHGLIVHPVDGWMASNTPKSVVLRVCGSDALAASVSVRELVTSQFDDRLHQLGMTPHDLNDFLAELFAASVPHWQTNRASS